MNKTLKEQLKEWQRQHREIKKYGVKKKKHPKLEPLTERDIKELMGINRPIYKRKKGGAFKQR